MRRIFTARRAKKASAKAKQGRIIFNPISSVELEQISAAVAEGIAQADARNARQDAARRGRF